MDLVPGVGMIGKKKESKKTAGLKHKMDGGTNCWDGEVWEQNRLGEQGSVRVPFWKYCWTHLWDSQENVRWESMYEAGTQKLELRVEFWGWEINLESTSTEKK